MADQNTGTKQDYIWVKLEGVLSDAIDPPSSWAIGSPTKHAHEIMEFAADLVGVNNVTVFGTACETPKGQRAVQRWLRAHGMYAWVTHEQTPPKDVEVIDRWPMNTTSS